MSMKIVVGLGSIDDYELYVNAGADELFCGYIPAEYMQLFGRQYPANRREVLYYNVQIGSESELLILRNMIERYGRPVTIAFNGLFYGDKEREYIVETVKKCKAIGYKSYIIAEPRLLERLVELEGIRLTVSGEMSELNTGSVLHWKRDNVKRVIYPRQTTIDEMAAIKHKVGAGSCSEELEYEAFTLNEKCHYTGAYCNSLHCDELCHMCRVPYRVINVEQEAGTCEITGADRSDLDEVGATGCAICKLWRLRDAGITHLKLVSRGNSTENTCRDIRALRRALDILNESENEREFIQKVYAEIFPNGCSKNCYGDRYVNPQETCEAYTAT